MHLFLSVRVGRILWFKLTYTFAQLALENYKQHIRKMAQFKKKKKNAASIILSTLAMDCTLSHQCTIFNVF